MSHVVLARKKKQLWSLSVGGGLSGYYVASRFSTLPTSTPCIHTPENAFVLVANVKPAAGCKFAKRPHGDLYPRHALSRLGL